jgi:hypothetical protein
MKIKLIAAILALAFSSAHAASTTVGVEYDYNHSMNNMHTHYFAAGVTESFDNFSVDGWVQSQRLTDGASPVDNINGWEVGVSHTFALPKDFTLYGRTAIGTFHGIGPSDGIANYSLTTAEVGHRLNGHTLGYASYSYTLGLNDFAIPVIRRWQVGVDTELTKNLTVRTGYSMQRANNQVYNGLVVVTSYTF